VHAGGLCAACYQRARVVRAPCDVCGEYKITSTGTCRRCQRRQRAAAGACAACGRRVARLWAGRRCAFCAHSSWTTGSCVDCYAWAASIADGRCRACRDFTHRNRAGECLSCRRHLPVNRNRRCRLCAVTRRDAHLAGDPGWAVEPGERMGIQLFFGDLSGSARRPRRRAPAQAGPAVAAPAGEAVQLELFAARPEPRHAGAAAHTWAASPAGSQMLTAVTAFAQARGWAAATTRAVQRAVALAAMTGPGFGLSPAVLAELRRQRVPHSRVREFLTASGLVPAPAEPRPDDLAGHGLAGLPAPMAREVTAWAGMLSGTGRRGRPRAPSTIASYMRALRPILREWAACYPSLRQVTEDDITACLRPLRGSRRVLTAVALRSLFGTLKARQMIFADPARGARPGKFPRRPVLGLDEATRAGLLAGFGRADHRLVVLLAGVHALSRADITALRLDHVDIGARTIVVRGQRRRLDRLTRDQFVAWMRERRRRWPATANPHVLVTTRSAYGLAPVSSRYFRTLPVGVSRLRADRLLAQARDTSGDALTLVRLFGLSGDAAVRYCTELDRTQGDARSPRPS